MAIQDPLKSGDRSRVPFLSKWFNVDEGAAGDWFPIGKAYGITWNTPSDSVTLTRSLEGVEEPNSTTGDANSLQIESDISWGSGIAAKMQALRDSGGNNHQLRLEQKGVKRRSITLSSSKKFKVDKTNATGGDGLGAVTLTGITMEDLGGFITKDMAIVVNSTVPTATNLFVVQKKNLTLADIHTKGYLSVYEYSLTTGLMDDDPTLAETQTGTLDILLLPDVRMEVNASLNHDLRGSKSEGQAPRGTIEFIEESVTTRVGNIGAYYQEDAFV